MAALTTNALFVPIVAAPGAAPRRRSFVVARAAATKHDEHQEPSAMADVGAAYVGGRRRAVMLFAAAATTASAAVVGQPARAGTGGVSKLSGQWAPIENVTDPYVQDLGKWAVMEHNVQTGEELQFDKVVSGTEQVVAGMNYRLHIATKGSSRMYEAGLFVSLPPEKRQLNSFTPES